MATDPTTNLRQAAEAAAGEIASASLNAISSEWLVPFILRHVAPAFERVQAQAAGMREALQAWVDYFDRYVRDFAPGDTVVDMARQVHGKRVEQSRAALAPGAGSALLARLAAAEGLAIATQGYYLATDHDGVMTDALRDALAAYRKLCPAEVK